MAFNDCNVNVAFSIGNFLVVVHVDELAVCMFSYVFFIFLRSFFLLTLPCRALVMLASSRIFQLGHCAESFP